MPSPVYSHLRARAATGAVAAFAADGCLWEGHIGEDFLLWMIGEGHVEGTRWAVYDSTQRHDVAESRRELLRSFAGLSPQQLEQHAEQFWQVGPARIWLPRVVAAVREARDLGITTCLVSASPACVLRPAQRHLPLQHCVGLEPALAGGKLNGEVLGVPTMGAGKVTRLTAEVPGSLLLAVGSSALDLALLRHCQGLAWAVNPDQDLHEAAQQHEWLVTWENQ